MCLRSDVSSVTPVPGSASSPEIKPTLLRVLSVPVGPSWTPTVAGSAENGMSVTGPKLFGRP